MTNTNENNDQSRRRFLTTVCGGIVVLPFAALGCSDTKTTQTSAPSSTQTKPKPASESKVSTSPAAVELIRLEESDPIAVALGYRGDATLVDVAKFPKRAGPLGATQFCHNCTLFVGKAGDDWAGCSIFAGKKVAANGWCNSWVLKS